jgi:hypothetical protein
LNINDSRQIDNEPVFDGRETCCMVSAAANGNRHVAFSGERNGAAHI